MWFICAVLCECLLRAFTKTTGSADSFGRVVIIFVVLHVIHRFARLCMRTYHPELKDLIAVSSILVSSVIMVLVGRVLAISLSAYVKEIELPGLISTGLSIDASSLAYAIPYAAGGVLVQSILGMQYGILFTLEFSLILSLYSPAGLMLAPFVLATTLIGGISMVKFRSRSAYMKSGVNVTLISLPFALSSVLISGDVSAVNIVVLSGGAILGGVLCSFIVGGAVPVLEYVGGYATDMTLLEIATLDHALLKELSVTAPGTWNHSMVMGMMAEQAAESVGAIR